MPLRVSLVLLIPMLAGLLQGQPPPGRGPRPWWDSQIRQDLNLSDAQLKQIAQVRNEFRPRMQESRDAVNKAEADVEAAFNEDPVDQGKSNDAINRLAAARAESFKTVSQMELRMRMVLTPQQWQDLKEKQRRPWPGGGRRGPRGPTSTTNQNPQK
jgi:Spy/CpxP family protein refolding chaperone